MKSINKILKFDCIKFNMLNSKNCCMNLTPPPLFIKHNILNSNICEESNDTLQNNKEKFRNYFNINSKFIFSQFGYNLLILSIIILIMGTIMTAVIGFYNMNNVHRRTFDTTRRFKRIDTAIEVYLAKYGKLPCPAPLNCDTKSCKNTKDRLGKEKRGQSSSSFDDIGSNCVADGEGVFETENENKEKILYGSIPAATLGLSNNYIIDAWGNKMVYMVPEELTREGGLKKINLQRKGLKGAYDDGNVKTEKYLGDGEVFLLMSFNLNIPGAFPYDSQTSNYFDKYTTKSENLPMNNFKINKNNTKYLYHHKKLFDFSEAFNSDKKSNNYGLGEPNCPEVSYKYSFTITEEVTKNNEEEENVSVEHINDSQLVVGDNGIVSEIYSYKGSPQTFVIPDGVTEIFIETWGARGGHSNTDKGGEGGYSYGYLNTSDSNLRGIGVKNRTLYVYVGGKGGSRVKGGTGGGWNGGGPASGGSGNNDGAGGGGTDVRILGGSWDNKDSLNKRIIVAGGGGAASKAAVAFKAVWIETTNNKGEKVATKLSRTVVPEVGGYGGGGDSRGGRGMAGYAREYGEYVTTFSAPGGGKYGDITYTTYFKYDGIDEDGNHLAYCGQAHSKVSSKVTSRDAMLGKSFRQGGGGYYGGGPNLCVAESRYSVYDRTYTCKMGTDTVKCTQYRTPTAGVRKTCLDYENYPDGTNDGVRGNNGGCGSGGGGSGYIRGVGNRISKNTEFGPGKKGGKDGAKCKYFIPHDNSYEYNINPKYNNTYKAVYGGCNLSTFTKTVKVNGLQDIIINDGEGKVRISYIVPQSEENATETISKTYTYTLTFPETQAGEEVVSDESCDKLVHYAAEPLDYYLLSTNRDVKGLLINNKAVNKCGTGGEWVFDKDDYEPNSSLALARKCIILPKCKPAKEIDKYKDITWDYSIDGYITGAYNIANTGIVKGVKKINETKTENVILQCLSTLKKAVNCGKDMSCYNNVNNYEVSYFSK